MTQRPAPTDSEPTISADLVVRRELAQSHARLRALLTRKLRDPLEADEVLQTFAVKALARSWSVREVTSVRAWLGRVLTTTLIDHQRRKSAGLRRYAPSETMGLEQPSQDPDPELDAGICDCLYAILPTMRSGYADIIRRLDILAEDREAVAGSLKTTVNNLNVRLHRARQVLRRRLEESCLTCPEHGFLNCTCGEERRRAEIRRRARSRETDVCAV